MNNQLKKIKNMSNKLEKLKKEEKKWNMNMNK